MSEFGLVPLKGEGKPIHPDYVDCPLTPEQYQKQLKAYFEAYSDEEKLMNATRNP